eukprot:363077-Pyramimonas_sp.AAC.1
MVTTDLGPRYVPPCLVDRALAEPGSAPSECQRANVGSSPAHPPGSTPDYTVPASPHGQGNIVVSYLPVGGHVAPVPPSV